MARVLRLALAAGLLAALLVVTAPATAHWDHERLPSDAYLGHIDRVDVELGPNETREWTLAFEGAPMPAGWHFLIRADVQGLVEGTLDVEGNWSARWGWAAGAQAEDLVLGATGIPALTLRNVGQENATVSFYYDHTCDCTAKAAPMSPGLLWLNVDAAAGDVVVMDLFVQPVQRPMDNSSMPRHINITARYLEHDAFGGYVPHATQTVRFRTEDPMCEPPVSEQQVRRWNGCMQLRFEAVYDGRQLVRLTTEDDAPTWHALIVPYITIEDAKEDAKEAPLPALLAVAAVSVALARRRHIA